MQGVTIELMKHYQTNTHRIFNEVQLVFSYENALQLKINGKSTHFYNKIAILNQNDIVKGLNGTSVVIIHIPLHFFSKYQSNYFLGYFDRDQLTSDEHIKMLIRSMLIEDNVKKQNILMDDMIAILYEEAYVPTEQFYIPEVSSQNTLLTHVIDYINRNYTERITLKSIAAHFFVSQSYISILFNKYIDINFKQFIVSLQINLSLKKLLISNETIQNIAVQFGFTHYSNYSKLFKQFVGSSPVEFRKQQRLPIEPLQIQNHDQTHFHQYLMTQWNSTTNDQETTIRLNYLEDTTYIHSTELFLESSHFKSITQALQVTASLPDFTSDETAYFYFNELTQMSLKFKDISEIDWLYQQISSKPIRFAFKIDSLSLFKRFENDFLKPMISVISYQTTYLSHSILNLNIVLDMNTLSINDIHYIKHHLSLLLPSCQYTLLIPLPIKNHTYQTLHQLQDLGITFDYFMLSFKELDFSQLGQPTTQSTYLERLYTMINTFINTLSEHQKSKVIFSDITEKVFNTLFEERFLKHPELFMYFLFKFNHLINGFALPFMTEHYGLSYYNQYGNKTSLNLIFELFKPFENHFILQTNQYLINETSNAYHILLFEPYASIMKKEWPDPQKMQFQILSTESLSENIVATYHYHRTLSNVEHIIPSDVQHYYIPSQHIDEVNKTNHLQLQLNIHHFNQTPLTISLNKGDIKLLKIYKDKAILRYDLES
ncbi:helix-turn-helix domain-containing protein [Staphylococcus sp. 11261D007BR]